MTLHESRIGDAPYAALHQPGLSGVLVNRSARASFLRRRWKPALDRIGPFSSVPASCRK